MPVKRSAKRCKISGKRVRSLDEFYREISRKLRFPDYFGRNLDALWDVLTTDVKGPVELIWEDSEVSKRSMGQDFDKVLALLKKVEKERDDFCITFA